MAEQRRRRGLPSKSPTKGQLDLFPAADNAGGQVGTDSGPRKATSAKRRWILMTETSTKEHTMIDPNKVLHELLEQAKRVDVGEDADVKLLARHVLALDDWLCQHGSLPHDWQIQTFSLPRKRFWFW